jgi:hypothetical protein
MTDTVAPKPQRNEKGQFLKGSQGLGGRKPGSRVKLEEDFVASYHAKWKVHGDTVLEKLATTDPAAFAKLGVGLMPKHTQTTRIHKLEVMTDKELAEVIATVDAQIEAGLIGRQGMN